MKNILLALIFLIAALPNARAQNTGHDLCALNPNVPVNIVPIFEEPTYDDSVGILQLQELSRDAAHVIPESLTLGLTHFMPVLSVSPVSTARDMPDGTTCVRIEHVDISFGYRNVVVYIAREIPQQTCGYNQVMLHEQKHVAVQKRILNDFIPVLQQQLKEYLAENGALQSQNYGEAVTWLRDNVQQIAQSVITNVMNENLRLQRDIDTVEEYTRVGNSCGGQLHHIVQNTVQMGQ